MTAPQPMQILAGTVPHGPGLDPGNPLHVLSIKYGPLAAEIVIPESNVETFLEHVTATLRRQVEAHRAERMAAPQPGLLVPGPGGLPNVGPGGDMSALLAGLPMPAEVRARLEEMGRP